MVKKKYILDKLGRVWQMKKIDKSIAHQTLYYYSYCTSNYTSLSFSWYTIAEWTKVKVIKRCPFTLGWSVSKFGTGENKDGWIIVLMSIGRGILVEVGDDWNSISRFWILCFSSFKYSKAPVKSDSVFLWQ